MPSTTDQGESLAASQAAPATTQAAPAAADTSLALAWAYFDQGRLPDATRLARQVLAQSPAENPSACAALGWFLLSAGSIAEAKALMEPALLRHPEHAPLHWYLGLVYFREQRLEQASLALAYALRLNPELDEAAAALAWVLTELDRYQEATAFCRQALAIKTRPERVAQLAWLLLCQEQWGEAAEHLMAALALHPERGDTRCHLATALQQLGRSEEALQLLAEGLLLAPGASDLLHHQIHLLLDLRRGDAARAACQRLLRLQPQEAMSWYWLALVLMQRKRPGLAARALSRARHLAPELPQLWRQTGWLALETGNLHAARQALERLLVLAPDDVTSNILAAVVLEGCGEVQAASQHAEKAVARAARSAAAWRALAQVRVRQGRLEDAKQALHTALDLDPKNTHEAYRQLGWVCHGERRYEEAAAAFRAAVANHADDASSWHGLAQAYRATGRYRDALKAIRPTLRLRDDVSDRKLRGQIIQEQVYYFMSRNCHDFGATPQTLPRPHLSHRTAPAVPDRGLARARPRLLVLDDAANHSTQGATQRRAQLVLLALRGCEATLVLLGPEPCAGRESPIPFSIEVVRAPTAARLEQFLENNADLYARVLVRGASGMARQLDRLIAHRPALLQDLALVYDAVAMPASKPAQPARQGQSSAPVRANAELATATSLARRAQTVLVASELEAAKFRAVTEADVRVAASDTPQAFDRALRDALALQTPGASAAHAPADASPAPCHSPYDYVVCSLSTKSHLPLMKTLAKSVRQHFAGRIYLLLIDSEDAGLVPEGTTLVRLKDVIEAALWMEMVERYSILELCCVLKSFLMRFLAKTVACPVIYLDADTYLLAPLGPLLPNSPDFSVFLTPHLLSPFSGERHADEIGILAVGAYNGGMLAVGLNEDGTRFLDWWAQRVSQYAYDSREQGVFTDQKWLDLVPSFFRKVHISQEAGLNVGLWRVCSVRDFADDPVSRLTFCGELVTLMHMSGFKPNRPDLLAPHIRPAVQPDSPLGRFLQHYANEVIANA